MNKEELYKRILHIKQLIFQRVGSSLSSDRDRRAIVIGSIGIAFFILFFSFQSFSKSYTNYQKRVKILENQLQKVRSLTSDYKSSKDRLEELTKSVRKEEEALISVVEKILVDENIERTSFSIKDTNVRLFSSDDLYDEKSVQVDIRKVPMNKVIDVLYKIQTRKSFLKVSDLRLKTKFNAPELIDASFKLSTFEFKKVT